MKTNSIIKGLTVLACLAVAGNIAYAKRLGIALSYQEQTNWCWAASTQMVLSNYGVTKSQSEIVQYTKGGLPNEGAEPSEIVKAIKWGGIDAVNKGVLSEQQIKSDADKGRTFVFAWYWSSGGGHALVYDGYEASQHYIHDPWDGTQAHSYSSAKNAGGKGRWKESMCALKDKTGLERDVN